MPLEGAKSVVSGRAQHEPLASPDQDSSNSCGIICRWRNSTSEKKGPSSSPERIGWGQRRRRSDRRRRRNRAAAWTRRRRNGPGGGRFYRFQRETAAAAGGLRIRSGSRRVDANPGDERGKGGGNDAGRRVRLGGGSLQFIGGRDVDGDVVG
jgi:hypothetical protein